MLVIGIMSCQAHRDTLQRAVRDTWLQDLPSSVKYLFMEGGHNGPERIENDRVYLDCEDTYEDLARKMYRFLVFVQKNFEFDYLFKCDDDTYVHVPRLLQTNEYSADYIGNLPPGDHWKFGTYAQGGAYVLSYQAVKAITSVPFESYKGKRWWYGVTSISRGPRSVTHLQSSVEDMMIGDMLREAGIVLTVDERFNPKASPSPYQTKHNITCHHVDQDHMYRVHYWKKWIYFYPHHLFSCCWKLWNNIQMLVGRYLKNVKNFCKKIGRM